MPEAPPRLSTMTFSPSALDNRSAMSLPMKSEEDHCVRDTRITATTFFSDKGAVAVSATHLILERSIRRRNPAVSGGVFVFKLGDLLCPATGTSL